MRIRRTRGAAVLTPGQLDHSQDDDLRPDAVTSRHVAPRLNCDQRCTGKPRLDRTVRRTRRCVAPNAWAVLDPGASALHRGVMRAA